MKSKRKTSKRKGALQLLDEMYIPAKIMLAASLAASLIIPLAVLSVCLIVGGGDELWYGGDASQIAEAALGGVAVSIGGATLLDIAHKRDGG